MEDDEDRKEGSGGEDDEDKRDEHRRDDCNGDIRGGKSIMLHYDTSSRGVVRPVLLVRPEPAYKLR